MPVLTEERPTASVETAQRAQVELNFVQNWFLRLPWLLKEVLIVGIIAGPVVALIVILKIIGL